MSKYLDDDSDSELKRKAGLSLPRKYKLTAQSVVLRRRQRSQQWVAFDPNDTDDVDIRKKRARLTKREKNLLLKCAMAEAEAGFETDDEEYGDEEEEQYDDDDEQPGPRQPDDSGGQSNLMKIGFALLMIPSVMVMVYGNKKFKSESNVDWAALSKHGFPGLGRIPGFPGHPGRNNMPDELRRLYDQRYRRRRRHAEPEPEDDEKFPENFDEFDEKMEEKFENMDKPNLENTEKENENSSDELKDPGEKKEGDEQTAEKREEKMEVDLDAAKNEVETETKDENRDDDDFDDDGEMDYPYRSDPYLPDFGHGMGMPFGLGGFGGGGGGYHRSWDPDPHLDEDTEEPYWDRKRKKKKEKPADPSYKVMLFWKPESLADNFVDIGTTAFEDSHCVEKKCVITTDRNYLPIADAVVFSEKDDFKDLPTNRGKDQKWIFQSTKPSNKTNQGLHDLDNLINWTWTYVRDSDVVYKLHRLKALTPADLVKLRLMLNTFDVWRRKKKMAFVVTNSKLKPNEEELIADLQRHIDLDTYGELGAKSCPDKRDCMKTLDAEYLFVIIFNDKYCADFLPQEIYHALHHNMVPVIIGKGNYSDITPPKSVIVASDFATGKDLGDYLNGIGSDYNLYKVFLEWKKRYRFVYQRDDLCQVCALLNSKVPATKTYSDVAEWWRLRACKA